MSRRRRRSLLNYWSIRYLLVLAVGIVVVRASTLYLVASTAASQQLAALERLTIDLGAAVQANGGRLPHDPSIGAWIQRFAKAHGLEQPPIALIYDAAGDEVERFPPNPPDEAAQVRSHFDRTRAGGVRVISLEPLPDRPTFLAAVAPQLDGAELTGYVVYVVPKIDVISGLTRFRLTWIGALGTIALAGWGVIYLLTRRLVQPIGEAVTAAQRIVGGDYAVQLKRDYEVEEVHALMSSLATMAERLNWLESLRTQLRAGVTHELKTPVASISGLIQAVRDGVVTGVERDAFLDMCQKECDRLQKMVSDLLDFNSFAANAVAVEAEPVDLKTATQEIVERWRQAHASALYDVAVEFAGAIANCEVQSDSARIEQILINLLNNARDSMPG
ncbi:MAG TPA: HAMP domain-containing sensor histidine kinase, partial [Limnochordia bacterium]|nr:HAMP domain-containing sensor histidine kinase [Limnochordia bacterium]